MLIIDVHVVTEVTGADYSGEGDIIAVCSSVKQANKVKIDHGGFANVKLRKAVVDKMEPEGDRPTWVLLLDPDEEGRSFPINIDLNKKQKKMKEDALAKLTPEEIALLKEVGLN